MNAKDPNLFICMMIMPFVGGDCVQAGRVMSLALPQAAKANERNRDGLPRVRPSNNVCITYTLKLIKFRQIQLFHSEE